MAPNSYTIPEEKILERLRFENPWWKTTAIDPLLGKMSRRLYFEKFFPFVIILRCRKTSTTNL